MRKTPAQLRRIIHTWKHVPTSVWKAWERYKHQHPKPGGMVTMYDSVTLSALPPGAEAYAGYVGGLWPTYDKLPPSKHKLSIAVNANENARCLDVEPGDATPDQAASWVKKQRALGEKMPVVYTSAAFGQALVNKLDASGLRYGKDYQWWSAHYTNSKHLCGPGCGFGLKVRAHATQWKNSSSPNLDTSICSPEFFA